MDISFSFETDGRTIASVDEISGLMVYGYDRRAALVGLQQLAAATLSGRWVVAAGTPEDRDWGYVVEPLWQDIEGHAHMYLRVRWHGSASETMHHGAGLTWHDSHDEARAAYAAL